MSEPKSLLGNTQGPFIPLDNPRPVPASRDDLRPGTNGPRDENGLTPYQQVWVAAFVGPARFNSAEATRIAGSTQKTANGIEVAGKDMLKRPHVHKAIQSHLESLKTDGIRVADQRIAELVRMNDELVEIQTTRAKSLQRRHEAGEDIPDEALNGLMVEVRRRDGASSWELDKVLMDQRRAIFEQVAKDLGERDSRIQIANVNVNGDAQSAKQKLQDLFRTSDVDVIEAEVEVIDDES